MADMTILLRCIRKSFSFLWDEFEFNLTQLKPREAYRNSGYEVHLENEYCKLIFMSEGGILDEIYVRTKQSPYFGWGLSDLTMLLTGKEPKSFYLVQATDEQFFDDRANYIRPIMSEILDLAKTPARFKETIEAMEGARKTQLITIDMIRAERARLHSLGLDSSLGAAIENLRKRGSNG